MEKIPINKYGEGNCCPECGSTKIDVLNQYPLYVVRDLKTGKERVYAYKNGKKTYFPKPSNRLLAMLYKASQVDCQLWFYKCRKCEWISEEFTP